MNRRSGKICSGLISLAVILTILLGFSPAALTLDYTFTPIDVPDATLTMAYGINNSGQIVGSFNNTNIPPHQNGHGLLLSNDIFTTIDFPGITWPEGTILRGINNSGQIVGSYGYGEGQRGFLLSGGNFVTVNPPGGVTSYANGINDKGQIVGSALYEVGSERFGAGFIFNEGNFSIIQVPGAEYTEAVGINNEGHIVGYFVNHISPRHGFLLKNGTFTTIDVPGAYDTEPYAINNAGDIAGLYRIPNGNSYGFLFSGNTFTNIVMPDGYPTTPRGINDSGQIVGQFTYQGTEHGFLATPVLEPVAIDIKPGDDINSINPKSKGKIPVAILSTENFDAPSLIDLTTLTFGQTGDEKSLAFCHGAEDVNRDGLRDLVCHFYTQDTGFQCGDTVGTLKGKTKDDTPIEGSDSVKIVPCK